MPRLVLLLFLTYFLLYEPLIGRHLFRRFAKQVTADPQARLRYYRTVMIGVWAPAVLLLLLCAMRVVSPAGSASAGRTSVPR